MGAIMSIGVATANSILVVSFANEQRHGGADALEAALAGRRTRLRPVIMTALAMIIGMLPMALARGRRRAERPARPRRHRRPDGGHLATLFFVPVVFSIVHGSARQTANATPLSAQQGHSHA